MIELSIIIPYYNAEPYTSELLDVLAPQIDERVEVIVVDDGSRIPFSSKYNWVQVIHKDNGGCASARNVGLEKAAGAYIQFIDADDLAPDYFVEKLLAKIYSTKADVIDYSWRSLTTSGPQHNYILKDDSSRLLNPSVCTRAFKRSYIGRNRFNEKKDSTEDEDFSRKVGYLVESDAYTHAAITDYMYFYRTAVTDSKIKRFKKGLMRTKRVTYYYDHVTSNMTWLLDRIKQDDEYNEVWLLTNKCDIPQLSRYCQIHKPFKSWTHYLKGEPYSNIDIIKIPKKYDVVMYCEFCNMVGGISTFVYNWCLAFRHDYKILFMYDKIPDLQLERLQKIVDCEPRGTSAIHCNTLILNRLTDKIPGNVRYKKSVQVCHACIQKNYKIPTDRDYLVNVSEAARGSWGKAAEHGRVIHNIARKDEKSLFLVSATRIGAVDKGSNDQRYRKLAQMLEEAQISYTWLNFSDKPLSGMPRSFINIPARLDIQEFIRRADYLVQLSDREAYSYSILEALINNTAVICTGFPSAIEQGVEDEQTGYIVPFDMNFDVNKLLKVPKFHYEYDNKGIKKQWSEIIEAAGPERSERQQDPLDQVKVRVVRPYKDNELKKSLITGQVVEMNRSRAEFLEGKQLVKLI